jgi:hypothetical protein
MSPTNPTTSPTAASGSIPSAVIPYERLMRENLDWGMNQSSLFFEDKGRVRDTLRRITRRLNELEIPYAVAGGMALFQHGYQRYTEDVDILVTRSGLDRLHEAVDGLGYVRPFSVSHNLRDVETGVKIEFLITGGFPGDGKPKEVSFPDPADVAVDLDGVRFLNLPTFVTLKLASGLTGENRDKDIIDILELIKAAPLDATLAPQLAPLVRPKYLELCERVRRARTRFVVTESVVPSDLLAAMLQDGIAKDDDGLYSTHDPAVAKKYGLRPDTEL